MMLMMMVVVMVTWYHHVMWYSSFLLMVDTCDRRAHTQRLAQVSVVIRLVVGRRVRGCVRRRVGWHERVHRVSIVAIRSLFEFN